MSGEGCVGGGASGNVLVCPICGKTAHGRNRRQNMDNHMLTHTGERPFQCSVCPYRASQQGNLRRHLRCVHKHKLYADEYTASNSQSGSVHYSDVGQTVNQQHPQTAVLPQTRGIQNVDTVVTTSLQHSLFEENATRAQVEHTGQDEEPPFGLHLRLKGENEAVGLPSHSEAGL